MKIFSISATSSFVWCELSRSRTSSSSRADWRFNLFVKRSINHFNIKFDDSFEFNCDIFSAVLIFRVHLLSVILSSLIRTLNWSERITKVHFCQKSCYDHIDWLLVAHESLTEQSRIIDDDIIRFRRQTKIRNLMAIALTTIKIKSRFSFLCVSFLRFCSPTQITHVIGLCSINVMEHLFLIKTSYQFVHEHHRIFHIFTCFKMRLVVFHT